MNHRNGYYVLAFDRFALFFFRRRSLSLRRFSAFSFSASIFSSSLRFCSLAAFYFRVELSLFSYSSLLSLSRVAFFFFMRIASLLAAYARGFDAVLALFSLFVFACLVAVAFRSLLSSAFSSFVSFLSRFIVDVA